MNFETLSPLILILVRYSISGAGVLLVQWGFSDSDATGVIEQLTIIITGGLMAALPVIYAWWKRPSPLAMEAAKTVDAEIPAGEAVILKTPDNVPDIVVGVKP